MNPIRWLVALSLVMFATACSGENPNEDLPSTFTILQGGSLFAATVELCGVDAAVQQGRGRWREWRNSDVRIEKARMIRDAKWGWKVIIPPGTYDVPRNLCADEAAGFLWLVFVIIGTGVLAVVGALVIRARREGNRPQPSLARG